METEEKEGREKNISQVESPKRKVDKPEGEREAKQERDSGEGLNVLAYIKEKQDFVQGVSALLDIMQRSVTGEMKDTVKKV